MTDVGHIGFPATSDLSFAKRVAACPGHTGKCLISLPQPMPPITPETIAFATTSNEPCPFTHISLFYVFFPRNLIASPDCECGSCPGNGSTLGLYYTGWESFWLQRNLEPRVEKMGFRRVPIPSFNVRLIFSCSWEVSRATLQSCWDAPSPGGLPARPPREA